MSQITRCEKVETTPMTANELVSALLARPDVIEQRTPQMHMTHLFAKDTALWRPLIKTATAEGLLRRIPQQKWMGGAYRTVGRRVEYRGTLAFGQVWTLFRTHGGMRLTLYNRHPQEVSA